MRLFKAALVVYCCTALAAFAADGPLNFYKNHFIKGDYVVGGVGLRGLGVPNPTVTAIANDGINTSYATGTISMNGPNGAPPPNAEIVSAYLYWQTIESSTAPTGNVGVFNGAKIVGHQIAPTGILACFGSGGGGSTTNQGEFLRVYRADVLRQLPVKTDASGKPLSRRLVSDTDLVANGFPLQTISLPDSGGGGTQAPSSGNQAIHTEGVSLVVVYRTATDPLRAVVLYDGGFRFDANSGTISQTIRGFYDSSQTIPTGKMTHIVGDGNSQFREVLTINGTSYANPFPGSLGQAWDNPTFSVTLANDASSVSMSIAGATTSTTDCLTWAAMVFSIPVQDSDGDGLLDVWESTSGLTDPNGNPLPDIHAMGADPRHKDLFIEVGFLQTNGYTTPSQPMGVPAHSHLPSQAVIDMLGDAYKNAPVSNPDGSTGIKLHVDVGNFYAGDPYVVPAALARGGEVIGEAPTDTLAPLQAQFVVPASPEFPDYPGTIGWKSGYRSLRDQPLNYPDEATCAAATNCVRRFDHNRKDMFHYVLFGHTLARQKWQIADGSLVQVVVDSTGTIATVTTLENHGFTLNSSGEFVALTGASDPNLNGTYTVASVPNTTQFTFTIPTTKTVAPATYTNFALAVGNGVPRSNSGIGDLPGADLMLTLGEWEAFVGSDFIQASTWLHELGHNFDLMHAGAIGLNTSLAAPPLPNCKPNYESSMSYLFQVSGLLDANGGAHINYSDRVLPSLNEDSLTEPGGLGVMLYKTRWYVPLSSSFLDTLLGTTVAKNRHCDGSPLSAAEQTWLATPGNGMVRVDSQSTSGDLDWNADGIIETTPVGPQDINFNGAPNLALNPAVTSTDSPFTSFNDWNVVDLQQLGGRRNAGALSVDVGFNDVAHGDPTIDAGALDVGALDVGALDVGALDVGALDVGALDVGALDVGGELDAPTARSVGDPPSNLTATVPTKNTIKLGWKAPHLDGTNVSAYQIWWALGPITPTNKPKKLAAVSGSTLTYTDTTVTPSKTYFYVVVAAFNETPPRQSGPSNQAKCSFTGTACQ